MGTLIRSLEELQQNSLSVQLPTADDCVLTLNSTVNQANFGNSNDKLVTFSHCIFIGSQEYVSTEFTNLTECILDAYITLANFYGR